MATQIQIPPDATGTAYAISTLAWERPHTTPGIHAFLGLASLPRFRTQANLLRLLPSVIVQRIARFAHRDAYLASWSTGETPTVRPTSVDIGRILNASGLSPGDRMRAALTMARPLRSGVRYVEVTTTAAWYGTRLTFEGVDGYECLGIQVDCRQHENARELCFIRLNGSQVNYLWIKSLGDDTWTWCNEPVVFGVLVDLVRGCVTFRLNGIDGPCVRFPNVNWRRGVYISISRFPKDPRHDMTGERMQLVASCATPPVPPSLLEAAAHPLTGAEHIAAGSMEYETDIFESDDDESDDDQG